VFTPWGNKGVAWRKRKCKKQCQVHADEEDYARPGWTTSRRGQDSPWKSQSEWQRTGINGESTYLVWPTLGPRTAKEQNRTRLNTAANLWHLFVSMQLEYNLNVMGACLWNLEVSGLWTREELVGQILEVIETSGLIYFALVRVVIRVNNSSLLWNQLPVSLRQPRTSLSISDSPVRVAVLPSVPSSRHSSSITPFTLSFQALNLSFLQILPTLGLTPRILQTVIIIIIIFCKPTNTKTQAGKLG